MTDLSFTPGQRWVSNTEAELGLGIILEISNRRLEISFPAAAERRTYAIDNAPISRVQYDVGQIVKSSEGEEITVTAVMNNNGCLIYQGLNSEGGEVILPEIDLDSFVQFNKPQDRLFAGQIDKNRAFELRRQTLEHIRHLQQSPVSGLLGARVQLLPHQLYIASEAASRHAPRVLLADEVGLGKTIEAGLILHQQLITGRAQRILVVVPDSLLHQWLVEMLRRFNLHFTILDEDRCLGLEERDVDDEYEYIANDAINPFESAQLVLCTLSFLTENTNRRTQAIDSDWDLLVVDEAHHLQWSEQSASAEYQCVEQLAQQANGLLLLTATPEQLGVAGHFARLRLLDPDRYYDLNTFIDEETKHRSVNDLVQAILSIETISEITSNDYLSQLEHYLGRESVQRYTDKINQADNDDVLTITDAIIRDLLDRHGTGRVLFRNTRSSVSGFPERQLHQHPMPVNDDINFHLKTDRLTDLLRPEVFFGEDWIKHDHRVPWLVDWLKAHRSEKVLVICALAETALQLEEHLRVRNGIQSAVFHEGLSLVSRDRAAAYFSDDEDGAQVLICSEIGSEGRNFQFSHHLVLFDLPINPDLLEQRIGRLDRIGQRNKINIHTPYYPESAQQVLMDWYHLGLNAFEKTCPAGPALYELFHQQLEESLINPSDKSKLEQLLDDTRHSAQEIQQNLQRGRDKLLELNSFNQEKADAIVTNMVEEERRQDLTNYMEQIFDLFGVEQEHHSAASIILRPGDHMLNHTFPGLSEEGVSATYSREVALSREDMQFITWEHPMVSGAMDMVLSGDLGNTAFMTIKLPPLKAGTILLEAIFLVLCPGPSRLQLQRYLPLTPIRIVVDRNNTDLSKVLTTNHMEKLGNKVARRSAQDLVRHARPAITSMIERAEVLANSHIGDIVSQASETMKTLQTEELSRLQALAEVNPNIRTSEIEHLKTETTEQQHYIQGAQLKLDAIRVALVTD